MAFAAGTSCTTSAIDARWNAENVNTCPSCTSTTGTSAVTTAASTHRTVVTATVAMASIDTGNAERDAHVLSPELLDVERRPTMTFRSRGVRGAGTSWALDGELTIGDVTRPLTLGVELGGVEPFFDGTRHAGFEATGELRRRDFGLGFGALGAMLGDVVEIELDLQFVEPA